MANPFVEGYRQSVGDTAARKQADLVLRQGEQELRKADYDLSQQNVQDTRTTEAYNYLRDQYGAQAGNPTASGQLAGIEQRKTTFQNDQTDRTEERERAAAGAALNAIESRVQGGGDATEAIMALPPAYRSAVGLTDETAAALGDAIKSNPQVLLDLRAGIEGKPTQPEYETGIDPDTKKARFFTRDPGTNQPKIVEGILPTAKDVGATGGAKSPFVSVAPGVAFDKTSGRYLDAEGNTLDANTALAAIANNKGVERYSTTTGSETAKADVDTLQTLPQAIMSSKNMMAAIDEVMGDENLELAIGSPSFSKLMAGGTGALGLEWPGSAAADAAQKIEYLRSAAFKEAFETLKGGGPITEVEGATATAAYADVQRARSPEEFRRKLKIFRNRVEELKDAKLAKAASINRDLSAPKKGDDGVVEWDSFFGTEE